MESLQKKITQLFGGFLLCLILLPGAFLFLEKNGVIAAEKEASNPLKVVAISPQENEVQPPFKISVTFSHPMAFLGEPVPDDFNVTLEELSATDKVIEKFPISCRWSSEKTLSISFPPETQVKRATRYRLTIKGPLKAKDGMSLEKDIVHVFSTVRPFLFTIFPHGVDWKGPQEVEFMVESSFLLDTKSLERSIVFKPENPQLETIPCQVREIYDNKENESLGKRPDRWSVKPQKNLSPQTHYKLVVKAGLLSKEGDLPSLQDKTLYSFKTYDSSLKFVGFKCAVWDKKINQLTLFTKDNAKAKCNPRHPLYLVFSAPVQARELVKNLVISPAPIEGDIPKKLTENPDFLAYQTRREEEGFHEISIPYGFKPNTTYTISLKPSGDNRWQRLVNRVKGWFTSTPKTALKDTFNRSLENPFSINVSFDHRLPNVALPYNKGILEKEADSDIPLYVNNLEKVSFTYQALTAQGLSPQEIMIYEIPKATDIQFAIPMNLRKILKGKSGVVVGKITTTPLVPNSEYHTKADPLFFQVTPFNIYLKLGPSNSLVWVTDLKTGKPVGNAKVTTFLGEPNPLVSTGATLAEGQTNEDGYAILPGLEVLDPKLTCFPYFSKESPILYFRVDKGEDMALLQLDYQTERLKYNLFPSGIYTDYMWTDLRTETGYHRFWGFTPQGIYRVGDTIAFKIYMRKLGLYSLESPAPLDLTLEVIDPMGKIVHKVDNLKFNSFGSFFSEMKIPAGAPMGWYEFHVRAAEATKEKLGDSRDRYSWRDAAFKVLVTDFTPSSFKTSLSVKNKTFQPDDIIDAALEAHLHSGGPFGGTRGRIMVLVQENFFTSQHPMATGFSFNYHSRRFQEEKNLLTKEDILSDKGEMFLKEKIPFSVFGDKWYTGNIFIEGSVQDDRGKEQTSRQIIPFFKTSTLVGYKSKQWLGSTSKKASYEFITVNQAGEPLENVPVKVTVSYKDLSTAKVKSAGNAYLSLDSVQWMPVLEETLEGTREPIKHFSFKPQKAGEYQVTAEVRDPSGRSFKCSDNLYVTGDDFVPMGEESEYFLPLTQEKNKVKIGENAKILVKNPYPGAQALITVERRGILTQYVRTLESSFSIIEIPVKPEYIPNFYVSVSVFAPRADNKPLKLGELDLAKPAIKTGYVGFEVDEKYNELPVSVTTERKTYRPGELVKATVTIPQSGTDDKMDPVEIALVVVDESVLNLLPQGTDTYDPYQGFYKLAPLSVNTYALLNLLVGRMKFEKKGANPGGDGGVADPEIRQIKKFVAYWNPSLTLNEEGKAHVEFEAPDNLTGWRLLAIATTPTDRMGLGEESFKVNRETEIRPVLPNQVREGDVFQAAFSVMNRTDKQRDVKVSILAQGALDTTKTKTAHEEIITLEPFQRTLVQLPVHVSALSERGPKEIFFDVVAGEGEQGDRLGHHLPVEPINVWKTYAQIGSLDGGEVRIPLAPLENLKNDRGMLSIEFSPTLLNLLKGGFEFLRDYPYTCWEQKLSRALGGALYLSLQNHVDLSFQWPDVETLPKRVMEELPSYQAPNGGLCFFRRENDFVNPYMSAFTALSLEWLKEGGIPIPKQAEDALHDYLDKYLRLDVPQVAPFFEGRWTLRALITEARSLKGLGNLEEVERLVPHVSEMGLMGRISLGLAALNYEKGKEIAKKILEDILSNLDDTGTTLTLGSQSEGSREELMDSPTRSIARLVELLVAFMPHSDTPQHLTTTLEKSIKNLQKASQPTGSWRSTQENLFVLRAFSKYAKLAEANPPQMTLEAKVGSKKLPTLTFSSFQEGPKTLMEPIHKLIEEALATSPSSLDSPNKLTLPSISLNHQGSGRAYYTIRLSHAEKNPPRVPQQHGFTIHREYNVLRDNQWVALAEGTPLKKGDLVRVDLFLIVTGQRYYVVINDPVPGGLEPIDRELYTSSLGDAKKTELPLPPTSFFHIHKNWVESASQPWLFYHEELGHQAVRYYADYLNPGRYHLSYVTQVIGEGIFEAPGTQVEAMYEPEIFGRSAPYSLTVRN